MIGVTPNRERKDDDSGGEVPDMSHNGPTSLIRILKVGVGQAGVAPLQDPYSSCRALRLFGTEGGTAPGRRLTRGQVQNADRIACIDGLEQSARTGELDVIAVRRKSKNVNRHRPNKAETLNGEQ